METVQGQRTSMSRQKKDVEIEEKREGYDWKTWHGAKIRMTRNQGQKKKEPGLVLPPAIHSGVKEMSSKAMLVHMSPPTSPWKVTLKGAGLDKMMFAYVHWGPWFPVVAHICSRVPLGPTVKIWQGKEITKINHNY